MRFDVEIEKAVLGSILIESSAMVRASAIIREEVFYKNEYRLIWKAISNLFKANKEIDGLTVPAELKSMGVIELEGNNVAYYVMKLTDRIASAAHIESHCMLIYEYYLLRELIKIGLEVQSSAEGSGDCFDIISQTEKRLQALTSNLGGSVKHIKDVHAKIIENQKEVLAGKVSTGILSGIRNLDHVTGGWQNGNLVIVGARPGMGKSAFALQLAKYPAMELKTPVAIFSMEMTNEELVGRMSASQTGINNTKINQKKLNAGELLYMETNCGPLIEAPIYLDDTPGLSIDQLKNKARKLYYEKGVRFFVIDYLQLTKGSGGNREQEISGISRAFKHLAKELNVPVVALCQLSRKVEDRPDKRPMLSDLRDSGAIEQDADLVMFLYRPFYYGITEKYEYSGHYLDPESLLMIDIAKGRGLSIGEVPAKFYGETMIITNYDL